MMMYLLIALLCVGPPVNAFTQTPDPRTQPATTVKEAIRVLEAKKYAEFLKSFPRPGDMDELLASRSMDDLAAEFGERRAPDLLAALRAAAAMTPVLTHEGTRAEYKFEKPFGRERRISLTKIGEHWYFR
jgi:hypothetical protein